MQQPFNEPAGSPRNNTYAAPPRQRGFNWMTCCLGCIGVVTVIVVIIGITLAVKLKQASGPPITATNFRQEFPAGVPVYPGLTLDEQATSRMHLVGGVFGLFPRGAIRMRMMAFKSKTRLDVIGPWYRKRLVPLGWKMTDTASRAPQAGLQFEKGDTSLRISDNDNGSGVTIMVGHGLNVSGGTAFNPR